MTIFLLFGVFFLLMFLKVPIAISMGLAGVVVALFSPSYSLTFLAQSMVSSADNFALMAIPFFILAGDIMGKGGISKRLFAFINVFVGRFYGGTAIATVVTAMFFAAISGSGPATVAAVGGMMIPLMLEEGYDRRFVTVTVATAGALGIIIPPSIPLVLYGVSSGESIGDLFLAGLPGGILIGTVLIVYVYLYSKKHGYKGNAVEFSWKLAGSTALEAFWAILVPVIVLGGIYSGIFTPTEAAVVAVVYSLFVSLFVYRDLTLKDMFPIFRDSGENAATILLVIAVASAFGTIMSIERMPEALATMLMGVSQNPVVIQLIILVLLLIVGMFMDTSAAVVIFTPILYPIAISIGMNPIHFGVFFIAALAVGFVTPPVGVNLFVAMKIANTKMSEIFSYIMPYIYILIITVIVIMLFPQIVMFLL